MISVNKVILVGVCGKDFEIKTSKTGLLIASTSLATSKSVKVNGEWTNKATWHNITAFSKIAEYIKNKNVKRGDGIYIEGEIDNSTYESDGVKKYKSQVIITEFKMAQKAGGAPNNSGGNDNGTNNSYDYDESPF